MPHVLCRAIASDHANAGKLAFSTRAKATSGFLHTLPLLSLQSGLIWLEDARYNADKAQR
jgi:hypothetical protein